MNTDLKILILPSEDGEDFTMAILYPAIWTDEEADQRAVEAFTAAQAANRHEWQWDDYVPELQARGFIVLPAHLGPTWDEGGR